ncbi:hypothetical protein BJX64DRAFT_271253 [Aspergillus heterothallicus]
MIKLEALGAATQRHQWFSGECAGLKKTMDNGDLDMDKRTQAYLEHQEMRSEMIQSEDEWKRRARLLWEAGYEFEHTAIARAMQQCRNKEGWHMHPWLVSECKRAGGCC